MSIFFTSDLHFFHENIIKYSNRPFRNAEEMNEAIIANWNSVVGPHDTVYMLGDVAMGGRSKAELLAYYLDRMNGNKNLVKGNHDSYVTKSPCREKFGWIKDYYELRVNDPETDRGRQHIIMSHYPMVSWHKMGRGSWMIHGHCHHSLPPDFRVKRIDVGIDGRGYDYAPISYEQLKNLMSAYGNVPVDHHGKNDHGNKYNSER